MNIRIMVRVFFKDVSKYEPFASVYYFIHLQKHEQYIFIFITLTFHRLGPRNYQGNLHQVLWQQQQVVFLE